MRLRIALGVVCLAAMAATLVGCGSSGAGTFPDFSTITKNAVPSFANSRGDALQEVSRLSLSRAFPSTASYDNSTTWDTVSASTHNSIGQVLLDAGSTGPVKSMFVVLDGASSRFADINSNFTDSSGNPTNCTTIASGTSLTMPYWDSITDESITISDADKYTCYTTTSSGGLILFGRSAISSPPAGCTDAFEYYTTDAYSSTSGSTVSAIGRFYYNGCTQEFKILYAQQTLYSTGVEFASRSEISGDADAGTFTLRTGFIDVTDATMAAADGHTLAAILGTGQSQLTAGGSGQANFIIGARTEDRATSGSAVTTNDYNFCAKNTSEDRSGIAHDSTTANCSALTTAYGAMDPLDNETADYPRTAFTVSAAAFGL